MINIKNNDCFKPAFTYNFYLQIICTYTSEVTFGNIKKMVTKENVPVTKIDTNIITRKLKYICER